MSSHIFKLGQLISRNLRNDEQSLGLLEYLKHASQNTVQQFGCNSNVFVKLTAPPLQC